MKLLLNDIIAFSQRITWDHIGPIIRCPEIKFKLSTQAALK